MSGTSVLLDTNIVLYLLAGDKTLAAMLNDKEVFVSFITEMELLSYKNMSAAEEKSIRDFLDSTIIIDLEPPVKQKAIAIRKDSRLKLPDSIIAASSLQLNIPLLTADSDFKQVRSLDYVQYEK